MPTFLRNRREQDIDSHTFWLMEQANSQVGNELVLNIREGAPLRLTRAQVRVLARDLPASPPPQPGTWSKVQANHGLCRIVSHWVGAWQQMRTYGCASDVIAVGQPAMSLVHEV